ncbi:adenylyltransferase/cytidyltransferase family protein [Nitrososphaera viennensis]|uniref:FAD synthase n=2 Tax=Nitrososphaera viennensis TaxID=1034015 RepID=A0A977IEU5_9ARCH|nr:adenylyltransferase/cytidyltransferase family protein [Nitrososphaera viennensis]AIC14507.1 putative FAD synthase [Nitrososphaera viennensis EN76]UVS69480.1 FAD synthase [Nitrososphaera viennensis]
MEPEDKSILAAIYASSLDPSVPAYDRLRTKLTVGKKFFEERIKHLVAKGMVEKGSNPPRLTFIGRDALKVVLVGGVFDLIHPGHIHTLKAAKEVGDVLVVVIARTATALKIKKDRKIYHDEGLRKELVESLSFVDLALIGREGTLYDTVEFVRPDVIALGYDQAHSEKDVAENCKKRNLNVQVIRLSTPIPGSKSSKIKEELGDTIYGI